MKQISFSKFALFVCLLCAAMIFVTAVFAQDTIKCSAVRVSDKVLINRKNGHMLHTRPVWRKVKCGFIIKQPDGTWLIDGKAMKPGDKKPLRIRK